jgi:catechol 2,3-dioxygenase-like lactoylglutathione lyase family enzyme
MVSRIAQWTLDVHDVDAMADFWSAVLGYRIDRDGDGIVHLLPPDGAAPDALTIWLQPTAEPKTTKNRAHPDLVVTDAGGVDSEVARLVTLGATRVDIGQTGAEPFVVLADPEGNEFCVLHRGDDR